MDTQVICLLCVSIVFAVATMFYMRKCKKAEIKTTLEGGVVVLFLWLLIIPAMIVDLILNKKRNGVWKI